MYVAMYTEFTWGHGKRRKVFFSIFCCRRSSWKTKVYPLQQMDLNPGQGCSYMCVSVWSILCNHHPKIVSSHNSYVRWLLSQSITWQRALHGFTYSNNYIYCNFQKSTKAFKHYTNSSFAGKRIDHTWDVHVHHCLPPRLNTHEDI